MPNMVDERVVSMQFDNAQFEQAVAQSMETLQNLNNSLKLENGAKGFLNLGKAVETVSFEKIQNGIEALQQRFSLWGELSHRAVMKVVDAIENKLSSAMRQFTIDPISDGFSKYENKMESVQTIMAGTGESIETVTKYLQDLNNYSDATIYSFADMTSNIGKFTNSGVKLDTAVTAMKGISNWAAISGANANEASRAMYNLAQSISMGYVQYIDWKSIENANMATTAFKKNVADMAVKMGTLTKATDGTYKSGKNSYTLQQLFKDGMKDQWFTTEVLTTVLGEYANTETEIGKKAQEAATQIKTFSQMMSVVKEMASTGWTKTFEIIFGNFYEARDLWTKVGGTLSDIIKKTTDARNSLLKGALGKNVWSRDWDYFTKNVKDVDKFKEALKKLGKEAGYDVDALTQRYGSFEQSLQAGWLSVDMFKDGLKATGQEAKTTTKDLSGLVDIAKKVINGTYGSGSERMRKLIDAGYDYDTIQALVNAHLKGFDVTTGEFTEEQIKQIAATEGQAEALRHLKETVDNAEMSLDDAMTAIDDFDKETESGRTFLLDSIETMYYNIAKVGRSIKRAFESVFEPIDAEKIFMMITAFGHWTYKMRLTNKGARQLRLGITGILKPIKAMLTLAGQLAGVLLPIFGKALVTGITIAIGLFSQFGRFIGYISDNFDNLTSIVHSFVDPLYNGIKDLVLPVWERFNQFVGDVGGIFSSANTHMEPFVKSTEKFRTSVESFAKTKALKAAETSIERIKEFGQGLEDLLGKFFNFEKFVDTVTGAFDKLTESINAAVDPTKITDLPHILADTWQAVKDFVKSVVQSIDVTGGFYSILKALDDGLGNLKNTIKGFIDSTFDFSGAWDKLKTAVGNFTDSFVDIFLLISEGKFVDAFAKLKNKFGEFADSLRDGFIKNDNLRGIFESLQKILGRVVDIAVELVGVKLPSFFKTVKDNAKALWESFDGAGKMNSVLEFLNGLLDKIQNGGAIDYIIDHLLKLGDAINNLFGSDGLKIEGATGGTSIFGKIAAALGLDEAKEGEEQVGILQKFSEKLQSAMDKFNEVFGKYVPKDAGGVTKLIAIFGALRVLFNAGTFFRKIGKAADIGKNLSEMFKQFGGAAKAYKKNMASGTFKNIAIGIALIVGSLAVLTMLNVDRLKAAVWAIMPVLAIIGAIYIAAKLLANDASDAEDAASPLKEFLDGLLPALKKMAAAIAFAAVAVGFGVALLLIAKGIATFTEMFTGENASKYMTGVKVVAIIAVALMAFAAIISKLGSGLAGVGTAFMGLATSLLIMRWVFSLYKDLDPSAAKAILATALVMTAIIAALMFIQKFTGSSLDGVSKTFLAVAGSLAILAFCMSSLAKLPVANLWSAFFVMSLLAVVITAVMLALSNWASNDAGTRAAKSFSKVASALKGLAIVAAILGFIPLDKIAQGFIALVSPLVIITVALIALAQLGGDLEQTAKTIIIVAGALLVMALAMVALGFVDTNKLIQGGIALGGIALGIVILVAALEKLDGSKAIKTLAVVAGIMAGLALIVVLLGSLPTTMIVQGLIAMILPLIAIVVALIVLSHFSAQIALLGTAFLEFGLALLAAAAGVYLFAVALPKLVDGIVYVVSGIINGIKTGIMYLYNSRHEIAAAIAGAIPTIISMIWWVVKTAAGALFHFITGIDWGQLLSILATVGKWIIDRLGSFGDWLGDSLGLMMAKAHHVIKVAVATIIKNVVSYISEKLGDMPILGDWIKDKAEGIRDGLDVWVKESSDGLDDLKEAYDSKYKEINETVTDGTAVNKKQFETAQKTNKAILNEMRDNMNEKISMTGFNGMPSQANQALRQMKATIQEETPEVVESTDNLVTSVNASADGLDMSAFGTAINGDMLNGMLNTEAFSGVGTDNIQAFLGGLKDGMNSEQISTLANDLGINLDQGAIDGIQSKLPDLQSLSQQMGIDTVDYAALGFGVQSPSWKFEEIGMYCVEGLKNGFNSGIAGLTGFMTMFSASTVGIFSLLPATMSKKMASNMTAMAKAIRGKSSAVRSAANKVATEAVSAVNKWQNFYNMGQHCVNGMISGIRSKISDARRAAEDLGNAVTAGTRSTTKVASPSRVFMEIGRFVVAGLTIGIARNAYQAASAAEDMGDSTIDAVANALSTLGRMAEEDINYTPTITPVVDLSSARLGFSSLNSMGSDLQLSLDGAINSKWDELNAMYDRLNGMTVGTDNSDVVSAINSLKADNAALRDSIANMKVMLNRRIVGQIDNGLGQQQLLANRGV